MSSSDVRMLDELTARVAGLEARVAAVEAAAMEARPIYKKLRADVDALLPKDLSGEVYGAEANHAADREARAALVRRPPRPAQ